MSKESGYKCIKGPQDIEHFAQRALNKVALDGDEASIRAATKITALGNLWLKAHAQTLEIEAIEQLKKDVAQLMKDRKAIKNGR
jgi:hypothetical protein